MGKYPTEITEATLAKNAHISDETIRRDIADTEREIETYDRLRAAEVVVAADHPDANERRMALFRSSARESQIGDRREFVAFLNALLAARANTHTPEAPDAP